MKKILFLTILLVISFLANAQTPIQEFNFDGNLSNAKNEISFSGDAKFVSDRAGVVNSAIRLTNSSIEATVLNLPVANSQRTVSIWVKYNDIVTANYVWGYGSSYNARYFGLLQQGATTTKSDLNLAGWGPANDVIITTTIAQNTWYNYVVTYDGLTSKIFRNGELIKSSISPRKLTSGIIFGIGKMDKTVSINADIDDLKIYDVALSDEKVAELYNSSAILTPNNNLVVSSTVKKTGKKGGLKSKTTPVNKEVAMSSPIEPTVMKSSEIYSTQGLKVYTGSRNNIDLTTLPEGTYLLKVINSDQSSNAQKLTVK